MLEDLGVTKPEIRLCLSDSACVSRFLDYPPMPARDLENSLRFEAIRELPVSPQNAYLGWQVVDQESERNRVLLVAAWRDVVDGYLQSADGIGRVTILEPRSLAIARAVGLPESTVVEWAADRLQVTQVQGRLVQYTTSVAVRNGAGSSSTRVAGLVTSLLPKTGGRRMPLANLVLLGKLRADDEIGNAFREYLRDDISSGEVDWDLPEPYAQFAGTAQMANVGLLMRN